MTTPSSPLLNHVPGASATNEDKTYPVAWHYGNPLGEQSAIEDGATGIIDRFDRVALWVHGEEAKTWLNDLISQKINAIAPGQATFGLILDVQGHVEYQFGIAAVGDGIILDVAADLAEGLETYLSRMIFWAKVEVERLDVVQVGVLKKKKAGSAAGEGGGAAGDRAGLGSPEGDAFPNAHSWRTRQVGEIEVTDVWLPADELISSWDRATGELGYAPTGLMAYTAWRITARQPVVGVDTDEKTIPHEVGWYMGENTHGATQLADESAGPTAHAVHLNKGCYRGQETVSRVQNLGKPPRTLVLLHLDGSKNAMPELGADLTAGGRRVGRVGSSVHDATYGPVALALVRRNVVEKLATDPSAVPALKAGEVDAAIDPADVTVDRTEKPGRAAVKNLRQR